MEQVLSGVTYWTHHGQSKPVCILVHGFTGSHEGFQYVIPGLRDYHIIAPDLPGFGISPLPAKPWTIDDLANHVNEFVQALNLNEPPFLVSHSMGTLIAASMMAQKPELFAVKTAFISPVATKIGWKDSRKIGAALSQLHYRVGTSIPGIGPKIVRSRRVSDVSTRLIQTSKDKALKKTMAAHHRNNLNYISSIEYYHALHKDIIGMGLVDYVERLESFDILIISGDKDNVTPLRTIQQIDDRLTFSLQVIGNVGHLAHYEAPGRIAGALRDFLR